MNKTLMVGSVVVSLGGFLFGFDAAFISGAAEEIKNIWNLGYLIHGMAIAMTLYGTTPIDPRLDHDIGRPGIRWEDYTNGPPTLGWARYEGTYGPYVKKKNLLYVNSSFRTTATKDFPWDGGTLNFPFIKYSVILWIKPKALIEINQSLDVARGLINQIRSRALNTSWIKSFPTPYQM